MRGAKQTYSKEEHDGLGVPSDRPGMAQVLLDRAWAVCAARGLTRHDPTCRSCRTGCIWVVSGRVARLAIYNLGPFLNCFT